ncbi:MAG TPA: class I SAM-dependent methyltransferase [Candidatus Binatia bacterium]|jgi:predicted O-methyltransferase YrrM|nr:class I SAM-dependent methyltransferase [Candidatus Binatia bacterium]
MSERGNDYADKSALPPLVARAALLAERFAFKNSCAIAYAPLLRMLAAQVRGGVIGEMGTGAGVGTAWMAGAMDQDSRIVTIEADAPRASAVAELFADDGRITVLHGDALELAAHGPFDLLYCDAGPGKIFRQEVSIAMMRPGGLILLDDLGPTRTDLDWWIHCPDVVAATIWITPDLGAILAVRR